MPDTDELAAVAMPGIGAVSIRDYFAAAALQGLLANGPTGSGRGWKEATAELAFQLGEAMVRAR